MARADKGYRGPCYYCVKLFKWIPVLFITLIILWSYYAYVHQLCLTSVESNVQKVIYLIIYHVFFLMLCWSYMQAIFTDVSHVPENFKIPDTQYESLRIAETQESQNEILNNVAATLPLINVNPNGSVRFCDKCKVIKPDRAHHCSVCGECVLKMDHHCPWINNCVCYSNYKYFIQFLGYALSYCIYVSATTIPYFIRFWNGELDGVARFHILFLFFVALMFGISLISLFSYHCYLVSENKTTLEAFRAPIFKRIGADKKGFHIGRRRNFEEVFGKNVLYWFLPIQTTVGDGIIYPNRHMV